MRLDAHGLPHMDPPGAVEWTPEGPVIWVPRDPPDHSWLEFGCVCHGESPHVPWWRRTMRRLHLLR